ncbi:hypothetical protein LCGC14_0674580 [marine sediment metagenome]|uniref:Uncharacterized protein n=1 Tax=marine sediment metagenome TaxID=412755 RepID=A0A0F9TBD6_9ZZZZ
MVKIIIIVLVVAFIAAVAGTCGWYFYQKGQTELPSIKDAPWEISAKVSGVLTNRFYTANVTQEGNLYIINGYWEKRGDEFWRFQDRTLKVNENWGEVTLRRR